LERDDDPRQRLNFRVKASVALDVAQALKNLSQQ
jgi:hypothetical protein